MKIFPLSPVGSPLSTQHLNFSASSACSIYLLFLCWIWSLSTLSISSVVGFGALGFGHHGLGTLSCFYSNLVGSKYGFTSAFLFAAKINTLLSLCGTAFVLSGIGISYLSSMFTRTQGSLLGLSSRWYSR